MYVLFESTDMKINGIYVREKAESGKKALEGKTISDACE